MDSVDFTKLAYILGAVILDGVAGLMGGLLSTEFIHRNLPVFLAFAAGTLTGAAFLDLLPEALHMSASVPNNQHAILFAALFGFMGFYFVESFLGSHATGQSGHKHSHIGPLVLVGDALHNVTDGVAIAAAFLLDTKTGIATTIAVIVHELPQEVSDFSILIAHGYSRAKALLSLFFVQLAALLGACGALIASKFMESSTHYLLAISAGGFIYIAAADLLPELHRHQTEIHPAKKLLALFSGLGVIALVGLLK